MLVLLPPSETKRDGGAAGSSLRLDALRFPELQAIRTEALEGLRTLSADREASIRALKLGRTQHDEVDRNRAVDSSPLLPAVDRYTGVLYDALDAPSLAPRARAFASEHLVIHSALFGPIGALDPIPAYRMSHDSRLPGLSLKRHWSAPVAEALHTAVDTNPLVLDLRSEAYVHLGPAPAGSWFVRVVSEGPDGTRRALNHFNKKGKGEFVRALLSAAIDHQSLDSLQEWAEAAGIRLAPGAAGELELVV
ncbi:peroxide stress protein YaaA [Diaminobutyricimonas sp. TR449]|uniref:YaaA family protein n=1 Tax=Diaminobutyricimonas sp. TR449 TaxID=2708076 RepID=UPI00141DCA8F|nr:peroxide stress protein YaaA [Diaminobutyricimonas sp. TR449]